MSCVEDFPQVGARARLLLRFERDLRAWLETTEGRFAVYCAERDRLLDPAEAPLAAEGAAPAVST